MKSTKSLIIIVTVVMAVFNFSCTGKTAQQGAPGVKHFRHLQFSETPYDVVKGIYPLTDEEAKTINNYTFTYNDKGQPVSIEFKRGDLILGYSNMGFAKEEISYTDSTEVHRFFDKDGKQVDSDGAFVHVYKTGKDGLRIGLSYLDKDGNVTANRNDIAYYIWKQLPDGMVKENRFNMKNEEVILNPFCPFYELRFSYDPNGYCVRMANYMADTLYDCTAENCGEVGVSYFAFENNDKGALTKFSVFNSHGQMSNLYWGWSRFENTLDENGNVTESFYWDQDNEPLGGKTNPLTLNKYDEHGSLVERQFMDKDRKLVVRQGPDAAVIKYTYDEKGNPADTTYFDALMAEIVKGKK
jgi:hypothetical protein